MAKRPTYTAQQAATQLNISDAYLRQVLIREQAEGQTIGSKHGKQWILSKADIRAIQKLPRFGTRRGQR